MITEKQKPSAYAKNSRSGDHHDVRLSNPFIGKELKDSTKLRSELESMANSLSTLRMENSRLRQEKERLLEINGMHCSNFEKIYESQAGAISPRSKQMTPKAGQVRTKSPKYSLRMSSLALDYPGLVDHCRVLQEEVKQLKVASELNGLKAQLALTNHLSLEQLIVEVKNLAQQNIKLRTSLNRAEFDLQKAKQLQEETLAEYRQLETKKESWEKEILQLRSTIIRLEQEKRDIQGLNDQQVYSLGVKCNALEGELRTSQLRSSKFEHLADLARIQSIEQRCLLDQHRSGSVAVLSRKHAETTLQLCSADSSRSRMLYYASAAHQTELGQSRKKSCRIKVRKHLSLGP